MVVNVQIRGLGGLKKFIVNLPKQTEIELNAASDEFMKFVKKSAKLRAPKMTGRLADSIELKKNKNVITLVVNSPYGVFQEQGFTPHWIHSEFPDRAGGIVEGLFNQKGWFFVSKHTPFVAPALEAGLNQLPQILERRIKKAVTKSVGR